MAAPKAAPSTPVRAVDTPPARGLGDRSSLAECRATAGQSEGQEAAPLPRTTQTQGSISPVIAYDATVPKCPPYTVSLMECGNTIGVFITRQGEN